MKTIVMFILLSIGTSTLSWGADGKFLFRGESGDGLVKFSLQTGDESRSYRWYLGKSKYYVVMAEDCRSALVTDANGTNPAFLDSNNGVELGGKKYAPYSVVGILFNYTALHSCR